MSDPIRIRISAGITRNLGNFESVRYDVSIEDTVRLEETIHDASLRIRRKTEEELQSALDELESDIIKTRKVNKVRGG